MTIALVILGYYHIHLPFVKIKMTIPIVTKNRMPKIGIRCMEKFI